jgi:hypothetical protein
MPIRKIIAPIADASLAMCPVRRLSAATLLLACMKQFWICSRIWLTDNLHAPAYSRRYAARMHDGIYGVCEPSPEYRISVPVRL